MPRRSQNQITKELALKIVDKLRAEKITTRSDEHDEYVVMHDGVAVARFGIRRSSNWNKGHDYVPGELGVGPNFAKNLAWCPKSRDDFLRQIGVLAEPDDANQPNGPEVS
jgi:hypothetical protein